MLLVPARLETRLVNMCNICQDSRTRMWGGAEVPDAGTKELPHSNHKFGKFADLENWTMPMYIITCR